MAEPELDSGPAAVLLPLERVRGRSHWDRRRQLFYVPAARSPGRELGVRVGGDAVTCLPPSRRSFLLLRTVPPSQGGFPDRERSCCIKALCSEIIRGTYEPVMLLLGACLGLGHLCHLSALASSSVRRNWVVLGINEIMLRTFWARHTAGAPHIDSYLCVRVCVCVRVCAHARTCTYAFTPHSSLGRKLICDWPDGRIPGQAIVYITHFLLPPILSGVYRPLPLEG